MTQRRASYCRAKPPTLAIGAVVAIKDPVGLLLSGGPDRDVGVRAGSNDAPVLQIGDRIHRAVVKTQHLLSGIESE